MNKILIIDESKLFRNFLTQQLGEFGFHVESARSGFEGLNRMRTFRPDLLIVDDDLNRLSINNMLKKKEEDVNIKDIPVIFTSTGFSQERIVSLCRVKVRRFLIKPLKMDQFLTIVSSFFNHEVWIDETECLLNLHVNEKLILVELAIGLNKTKLGLLPWKIKDVIARNDIVHPKIMLLISDINIDDEAQSILSVLLDSFIGITGGTANVKILTIDNNIKKSFTLNSQFGSIDICSSLMEAIDAFFGKKGLENLTANQDNVHRTFLSSDDSYDLSGLVDINYKKEQILT